MIQADLVEKTDEAKEEVTAEEASVLVEEPMDEICPDELYARNGNEKPNPKTRPSTFRGLGGVDYYTLTYEDYSDDSEWQDSKIWQFFLLVSIYSEHKQGVFWHFMIIIKIRIKKIAI